MAGVYIHIPFCKRLCAYCDFYKSARVALLGRVVEQMHRELQQRASWLQGASVETLYFGGGTPSLCSAQEIGALIEEVKHLFHVKCFKEVTLEANPDDLTYDYLTEIRQAGVDRLSIGVQSFDDEELRWMNRRHNAQQAERAVQEARRAGFEHLTIDLIFGVPGFGKEVLQRTLERALALDVEHISAYHLTIEPDTALGRRAARGELQAVEESISESEYALVHQRLTEAGYAHYEISNYARKGCRARHNSAYWHGIPYLGIGPGAHSFDGSHRCWSTDTVEQYAANGATHFEQELLTERDHFNEWLMTRLRTAEGISLRELEERFGTKRAQAVITGSEALCQSGVLKREEASFRIPATHFLLSDWVIGQLMETE